VSVRSDGRPCGAAGNGPPTLRAGGWCWCGSTTPSRRPSPPLPNASVAVSLASVTPAALITSPWREVLLELIATRGQVRRFAVNVNQAVAALNATGETPPELAAAVAVTTRAVARLDLIAADLQRRLR
jgi:hypothetical protein